MKKKQVMDIRSSSGMTSAESDEHQRKWDNRMWQYKSEHDGANYDRTRAHLNFEVAKGGVVQPIDTSRSIVERFNESLAARGIRDPNIGRNNPNIRTLANFIFQGSRELMHQLAFNEPVSLEKGADNSHVTRKKDIEEWAKDMYKFVSDKFGEENIVGFYVHLDEANPHVHCSVIPVTPRNSISWKYWFVGNGVYDAQKIWAKMHSDLAKINAKYGLERGECIHETGAKHISTEEYRRTAVGLEHEIEDKKTELDQLYSEINKLKTKIKSFETMIVNLEKQKDAIEQELQALKKQVGAAPDDSTEEIVQKIGELNRMLADVSAKLDSRRAQLQQAKADLEELKDEKDRMLNVKKELLKFNIDTIHAHEKEVTLNLSSEATSILSDQFSKLLPTLSVPQLQTLFSSDSQLFDAESIETLATKTNEVIACAALLYSGFINEATTYAVSHGGAQSAGTGWGRKDDDDDWIWRRRCLGHAARMMSPRGRGRKR